MYRVRTKGYSKRDPQKRWALPDRVFFACGACHILAHVFLERHGTPAMTALWIKPEPPFTHGHIVVATEAWIFDYHGYTARDRYLAHTVAKAQRWWPGWHARLHVLPRDVLVSEARSRRIDGLWLREPAQFLHDPLPRARAFLDRFPGPACARVERRHSVVPDAQLWLPARFARAALSRLRGRLMGHAS